MIEGRTKPLEIAARVLKPETVLTVSSHPWENRLSVYAILDRWALHSPELLEALESLDPPGTPLSLIIRVTEQYRMESLALLLEEAWEMERRGWTDWEILAEMGVDTELKSTRLSQHKHRISELSSRYQAECEEAEETTRYWREQESEEEK